MTAAHSPQEENILHQILERIPEAQDWIHLVKFHYTNGSMEVVLNDLPETIARKIMSAFNS